MSIQVRRKSSGEITAIRFQFNPFGLPPLEQYQKVLDQLPNDDVKRKWMAQKHIYITDQDWCTVRPA